MSEKFTLESSDTIAFDAELAALNDAKDSWAKTSITDRIKILNSIKDALIKVAEPWVDAAAQAKGIEQNSALVGEEWFSGPYAVMLACNGLIDTLSRMKDKSFIEPDMIRTVATGQAALCVTPHSLWDRLFLSGVRAEVWMRPGIEKNHIKDHVALAYDIPKAKRKGKVALVLGAGNISSIAPLDVFQKIFLEHQVVMLKMNPVNEYLTPFLSKALNPLIERNALRIVKGAGAAGAYLCEHDLVDEIHITGAQSTHDAIIWGTGNEAIRNKAAATPKNTRKITSELGAVCPTIVVPGPWSKADIRFQAEQIATQKLHNSGFNCIACQTLIMPENWDKASSLINELSHVIERYGCRPPYYPGANDRINSFSKNAGIDESIQRGAFPALPIVRFNESNAEWLGQTEIFAPALALKTIPSQSAETYLEKAIDFANRCLAGTLGANIVIHPDTIKEIGEQRFEKLIASLHYGTIAINTWSGLAFALPSCPWGGYPNSTLDNVGSGIGTVHNTLMIEDIERTVVSAPWRPFPRGLISGQLTTLPKPPWFINNRQQHNLGKLLTEFYYKPSWMKVPKIFIHALLG